MVTTKRPDPKTTSKDERTRLAVVAFYKGEIEQRDIVKCYGNVSRQLVVDLARKLPQGLVDDDERLQLWRGSHRAVGLALPNRAHTDAEYRDGIYKYASGAMKQDEVFGKYGVKPTALKARVRDLKTANGGSLPPPRRLRAAVDALELRRAGAPPLLEADESKMLVATLGMAADAGVGMNRRQQSARARDLCKALAEDESNPLKKKRLEEAACGSDFLKRARESAGVADPKLVASERKPSDLSQRRADAGDPYLNDEMFDKLEGLFDDHYEREILKTPRPRASQVYTGDEMGLNPKGKWYRVLALNYYQAMKRLWRVSTGEHAPFWVTLFFFTRCDGQMPIPPCIIHESATVSEFFAMHLPEDWTIHCTKSGYNDRDGMLKIARSFLDNCQKQRPLYIILDGHESHFCADALDLLANDHVYVFFLKSADSENDQLNDNGPNLSITSCYAHAVADWLNRNPGVPYNPAFFNQVIVQAWDSFAAESGPIICRAAAKVGLYPLDRNAVNFQCKGDRLAQVHAGEQADDGVDDFAVTVQPKVTEGSKYSLLQARVKLPGSKKPETASLLLRSAAVDFFQTSTVAPAREIVEALGDQKRARKNKLSDDAVDHDGEPTTLRNPSTKSGLFACADVRAECRRVEEARASKQQEKDEAARRTEARRVDNRRRAEAKGLWFLKQYDARAVGADLASLDHHFRGQAAVLTDVLSFLDLDTSGSKADKILRLRNYLLKRPECRAQPGYFPDDSIVALSIPCPPNFRSSTS